MCQDIYVYCSIMVMVPKGEAGRKKQMLNNKEITK